MSIYTRYLVEGIEKGAADSDGDGWIAVEELHEYASKRTKEATPAMTPKFYPVEEGYRIIIAKSPKDDPKLKYRKEVQIRAEQSHGKVSIFARRLLDNKQKEWGISAEEAKTIEDEVLQPYRDYERKLQEYAQTLIDASKIEYPFSPNTQLDHKDYQKYLGLRDADIADIEAEILTPLKVEHDRKQQEVNRLKQEQTLYEDSLRQYEREFLKAVQNKYPFSQDVVEKLQTIQHQLGLHDKDIGQIEQPIREKSIQAYEEPLDLGVDLKLDFREAVFGGKKEIRISHLEPCHNCAGIGFKEDQTTKFVSPCSNCNGEGRRQEIKKLLITIPAGVDYGTRLRVSSEGNAGQFGRPTGDLYIFLFVNEDEEFKRDDINILSSVEISPAQANSGCNLSINTLNGAGSLKIPRGTKNGAVLRLRGRGVPRLGNPSKRGDHLVTVNIS